MRQHDPKLARQLELNYEAGLHFKHRCGEQAYPAAVIDDAEILWSCIEHGLVEPRSVTRN